VHKLAKGNDSWALVAILAEQVDITKQEQYLVNGIPGAVQ
jgi:3-mercaptopyruvate sulfurtransferase SseA